MDPEIIARFVHIGNVYKICPLMMSLKKSNSCWQWQLEIGKNRHKFVNFVGFFMLCLVCFTLLVQSTKDISQPILLAFDLGLFVVLAFSTFSQYQFLTDSGIVQLVNCFFKLIFTTSKFIKIFTGVIIK